MVYNNSFYRPTSLAEKLRVKFGERTANAIFRANSASQSDSNDGANEVLSFFGRPGDVRNGDRAIPSARRTARNARVSAAPSKKQNAAPAGARVRYARPVHQARTVQQVRPVQQARTAQQTRPVQQGVRRDDKRTHVAYTSQMTEKRVNGYGRAYKAGDRVKNIASSIRVPREDRYERKYVSDEALSRGRSSIPGSRHASIKHDSGTGAVKRSFSRLKESFKDIHKAEHRVKKAPLPFAYATLVAVCAVMAMVLLFSYSQVSESEGKIARLNSEYSALSETASKLELELETRDDIRKIESIAVDYIGMVNSDVVQSKFVSVSADDKVEILKNDSEEEEGGLSALLSAIGDSIGKFSEYFN